MNTNEAAQILLTYFSPEERSIPDNATYPGRNAAVRKAMNDALQDLFSKGKPWCRSEERGTLINAPVNLSVKVTQGSPVAEIPESEWRSWFRGCTLAIEGVSHDNQVKSDGEIVDAYPDGSILINGPIDPAIGVVQPAGMVLGAPAWSTDGTTTPSGSNWSLVSLQNRRGAGNEWCISNWQNGKWRGWCALGYYVDISLLEIPAEAWVPYIDLESDSAEIEVEDGTTVNGQAIGGLVKRFFSNEPKPGWTSSGVIPFYEEGTILYGMDDGNWSITVNTIPVGFRSYFPAESPELVEGWYPYDESASGAIIRVLRPYQAATGLPVLAPIHAKRQFILKLPYVGASGTHTARLFHDCITLGADVLEVHEPVNVGGCEIRPLNNSSPQGRPRRDDYGFRDSGPACCPPGRVSATAGTPRNFHVETYLAGPNAVPTYRLRLMPAPSAASLIEYDAMLVPPKVSDLASTAPLSIPFDFAESVFLPIAVKKLRSSPFWRGVVGEDQVQGDYLNALGILNESQPQRRSGISFRLPY